MTVTHPKSEGDRLRDWLRSQNMTQGELAERLGKDRAQISKYITGERPITGNFKHEFAAAFGVSAHDALFEPKLQREDEHEPPFPG